MSLGPLLLVVPAKLDEVKHLSERHILVVKARRERERVEQERQRLEDEKIAAARRERLRKAREERKEATRKAMLYVQLFPLPLLFTTYRNIACMFVSSGTVALARAWDPPHLHPPRSENDPLKTRPSRRPGLNGAVSQHLSPQALLA